MVVIVAAAVVLLINKCCSFVVVVVLDAVEVEVVAVNCSFFLSVANYKAAFLEVFLATTPFKKNQPKTIGKKNTLKTL